MEDIFNEKPVIKTTPKINYDELDAAVIKKLCSNEIDIERTVKNLEKWYKGNYSLIVITSSQDFFCVPF